LVHVASSDRDAVRKAVKEGPAASAGASGSSKGTW
jgi:hypothetical protein